MRIREARRRDLPQLEVLYDEFLVHNAEKQPAFYREIPVDRSYPKTILKNRKAALLVAADDTQRTLAGFIHVSQEETPPFEAYVPYRYALVVDLYVDPAYRGQGIGRALVESARNWAFSRDLSYLEMTVLEEDLGARTFSRQMGFQESSRVMRSFVPPPAGEDSPHPPPEETT